MIAILHGKIVAKCGTQIIIDCNGIGFLIEVPYPFAESVELNSIQTVHIQSVFSRNGLELFGFKTAEDKEIFNILTSIRGIGGRAGINILSRMSIKEIQDAIDKNQVELFKTIPGIGQKKAETIIFNLRKSSEEKASIPETHKEVVQALINLGFSSKEAMQKLSNIPEWTKKSVSELIQAVLKNERQKVNVKR